METTLDIFINLLGEYDFCLLPWDVFIPRSIKNG